MRDHSSEADPRFTFHGSWERARLSGGVDR